MSFEVLILLYMFLGEKIKMNTAFNEDFEFAFTDLKERLESAKRNHVTKLLELSEKGEMLTDNQFFVVEHELQNVYTKEKQDFEKNNQDSRKQEMFEMMKKAMF